MFRMDAFGRAASDHCRALRDSAVILGMSCAQGQTYHACATWMKARIPNAGLPPGARV